MSGAAGSAAIQLKNLTVDYASRGKTMRAVDDVSLDIAAGDFVALLGPSGCGKSTILRTVAGLLTATGGTIEIGNLPVRQPLQAINPEVTRRLQEFAFDQDEVTEVLERVRMNEERKRRKNGVLLAALPPSPRARERAWMRG